MNTTFTGFFALESFLKIHAYGVRVRTTLGGRSMSNAFRHPNLKELYSYSNIVKENYEYCLELFLFKKTKVTLL
jgi:hypothetical protein